MILALVWYLCWNYGSDIIWVHVGSCSLGKVVMLKVVILKKNLSKLDFWCWVSDGQNKISS